MRRRASDEKVEQFRQRKVGPAAAVLYHRLSAWCKSLDLTNVEPDMPATVMDRAAECWEPLLAVADAAGGNWPDLARQAAVHFVQGGRDETTSPGIELLSHIQEAFGDADALWTETLLERLHQRSESPWKEIHGKPLNDRGLAQRLKNYRDADGRPIKSRDVKLDGANRKGYRAEQFQDVWRRYLGTSATSATNATLLISENKKVAQVAQVAHLWPRSEVGGTCAQCAEDDGKATIHHIAGKAVRLHAECRRFYAERNQ
jgi:hypothetical protein